MLERRAVKVACVVLRGLGEGDLAWLPGSRWAKLGASCRVKVPVGTGTLIGIKYLGKGHSKASGKTYNRYEVAVQDPLPVVDATELEPPWEDE